MARGAIRRFSDGTVQLVAPLDYANPSTPATATGTATFRLYDDDKRSRLTKDTEATETGIFVENPNVFSAGDAVAIRLDDTTSLHHTTISAVGSSSLILAAGIPAGRTAKKGGWIQAYLGTSAAISMTAYGTPSVSTETWGYIGTIPDDLDLFDVSSVGIEVEFVQSTTNARLFKRRTEPVIDED